MTEDKNSDLNKVSSSNSSNVGPRLGGLRSHPIYSQPRLLPAFHDARMEQKMKALNLSIGIKIQKKIVNYGCLDAKVHRAKEEEDIIQEAKQQPIEEDEHFPRATHLARKLVDKDPNLDFMDPDRREKLTELYS
jgi:hypothetical protein